MEKKLKNLPGNSEGNKINIIILSKDRAMQLDSLLRSINNKFKIPYQAISILYKYSSRDFMNGYEKLINRKILPKSNWFKESCFEEDVHKLCNTLDDSSLIMFLVDDNVVFNTFENREIFKAFTEQHLFISLRASRKYKDDVQPVFIKDKSYLEWKWNYYNKKPVTWNYPFSIDGNIFRVSVIKKILKKISFTAPNSFEGNMHRYRHAWWIKRIKRALAPVEPVVVNNPLNSVQTEGETWNKNISVGNLNEKYLEGYQINNNILYSATPTGIHYPMDIVFRKI